MSNEELEMMNRLHDSRMNKKAAKLSHDSGMPLPSIRIDRVLSSPAIARPHSAAAIPASTLRPLLISNR